MLWAQSHYSLNISEGRQIIAFPFFSSLSSVSLHILLQTIFAVP